uniref:Uncharacterized protein n=1 Tax=Arundo donax TaxID=35708 RepID=A0A0A9GSH3_ARUDO
MLREPSSCRGIAVYNSLRNQPIKVTGYPTSSQCQRSYNLAYCSLLSFPVHSSSATTPLLMTCKKGYYAK